MLAPLSSARDKGADAKVKAELNSVRSQSAIYFDDNSATYIGFCAD